VALAEGEGVRSRIAAILLLPLLAIALPAVAHADAPGVTAPGSYLTPPATPPSLVLRTEGYRLHLLAADSAAVLVTVLGAASDSEDIRSATAYSIFLFAPAMHLAHGNPRAAAGSLGLRFGMPLVGAMAGFLAIDAPRATSDDDDDDDDDGAFMPFGYGTLVGFGVGFVSGIVLDYTLLAKKETLETRPSWQPTVSVSSRGASVGLAGRF
jgi:hypothetical protein